MYLRDKHGFWLPDSVYTSKDQEQAAASERQNKSSNPEGSS